MVTTTNVRACCPKAIPSPCAGIHLLTVRDLVTDADVVLAVGTELAPADLWNGAAAGGSARAHRHRPGRGGAGLPE